MGRLLVSVRGPNEALAAARGGAHIADVEFPGSALGTPYPLNIKATRRSLDEAGFEGVPISTNIGEDQTVRSTACQAALGVAIAGADFIKCGFAGFNFEESKYLGSNLVRTIKEWCPDAKVYPAVFPEERYKISFDPITQSAELAEYSNCDGILIDTYDKNIGKGLLDYYSLNELKDFVDSLHSLKKEAWLAGSVVLSELPGLWRIGADVVCVRGAACEPMEGQERFGEVKENIVKDLVETII